MKRLLPWCFLLLAAPSFAGESGRSADGERRRGEVEVMQQRAAALRTEADSAYSQEERRCYNEVLTNKCREQARQAKVAVYQKARQLDMDARRTELDIRREEKALKDQSRQGQASEKELTIQRRVQDIEQDREQQQRQRADNELRKAREASERAATMDRQDAARRQRLSQREQRLRDKAEKQAKNAEWGKRRVTEETERKAQARTQP